MFRKSWKELGNRSQMSAVLFSIVFLVLLSAFPNASASTVPAGDRADQTSLKAAFASSSTVYLFPNATGSSILPMRYDKYEASSIRIVASSPTQYTSSGCLQHVDGYYWYSGSCYPYYDSYYYHPYYYRYYYYPYYGRYYYPYYYGYYYPTATVQITKAFDLKVETAPSGIAAVSGTGTYNQGTVASFSTSSSIVPMGAGERYVFSNWSGDFSGGTPSGTITMDSSKIVVANYRLENYLRVAIDPQGIAATVGEGWYDPGASVMVGPVPPLVSGGEGVRYVFEDWTVDGIPVPGNPVQVAMDIPHSAVAHYKTQYLLTVESEYGYAQGSGWYDASSTATFSVTTAVDTSYGVRQVFDGWTGEFQSTSSIATVTMNSPLTVRAAWRTDSMVLYATIALAIAGAFALGIGLTAIAIRRQQQQPVPRTEAKPIVEAQAKPIVATEEAPKRLKPAQVSKRVKKPPKTSPSEESPAG